MTTEIMRIAPRAMKDQFERILRAVGFTNEKADTLARTFMENSLDGVYTHGVNRFADFVDYVRRGYVATDAELMRMRVRGNLEQWDGNSGPVILNALKCTDRAM